MTETEIKTLIKKLIKNENPEKQSILKQNFYNFCKDLHFFKYKIIQKENINKENIINNFIKNMTFVFYKKDDIIWNIGDKVNGLYIIFLGEVNVYKPHKSNNNVEVIEKTLSKGYLLGEEYVINNFTKHMYKIEAKTNCILGCINIKEYTKIFNKIYIEEYVSFLSFFINLKLFQNNDFIERIQRMSIKEYYYKNKYIFKQDEPYNTFYFIFSGIVRLTVNLKETLKSIIDNDINHQIFPNERNLEMKGFYNGKQNYNIIDLSSGDFIGAIEYLNHFDKYKYDIKCLTDVEVYKIDIEHFRNIAFEEDVQLFHKKIIKQEKFIHKRIEEIKKIKFNIAKNKDYILSQNKYNKAFSINNPITENIKDKDYFFNNPFELKSLKYSKKHLSNIFLTPRLKQIFLENKKYKSPKENKEINIKDLVTNIDINKKYTFRESISSKCLSREDNKEKDSLEVKSMNAEKTIGHHYSFLDGNHYSRIGYSKIFSKSNLKGLINKNNKDNNFFKKFKKDIENNNIPLIEEISHRVQRSKISRPSLRLEQKLKMGDS